MSWNPSNRWKLGKVEINSEECPNCKGYLVKVIKPDLTGCEWVCFRCRGVNDANR